MSANLIVEAFILIMEILFTVLYEFFIIINPFSDFFLLYFMILCIMILFVMPKIDTSREPKNMERHDQHQQQQQQMQRLENEIRQLNQRLENEIRQLNQRLARLERQQQDA
jgi:septal ring factor EnvC (AmiA/AmiB activator)